MKQRELSYQILKECYIDQKYANLIMRNKLNVLEVSQRPFVSELVYGVIRKDLLLRFQFEHLLSKKTKMQVIIILMMAYYEYHFMHNHDYVVVNEYVSLAPKYAKSLVNGLLRQNLKTFKLSDDQTALGISINNSIPLWIVKMLMAQYDNKTFKYLIDDYHNQKPKIFYRINPLKAQKDSLKDLPITFLDDRYFIADTNLINHPYFKSGMFYIQDYTSHEIVDQLAIQNDDLVLDMAAAPGSKTFNILETLKDVKQLYINDISLTRLKLIENKAHNLGYPKLNLINKDGVELPSLGLTFDKILLDTPCSGLGVLKRKVDLKNKITPSDLDALQNLAYNLLNAAKLMLKDHGILVYSTCTLNRKENDRLIDKFIENNPDLNLIESKLCLAKDGSDSFFYAKMQKIK